MTRKRAVIADDHGIVRTALREILTSLDGVDVVGEAANGLEAIAMAKALRPDLLTLDAGMPLSQGIEAYGEVRRWSPQTRICVITGFTSAGRLRNWLAVGVDGLLLKSTTEVEFATGLMSVLNGNTYISPSVTELLDNAANPDDLTLRERQVLHLLAHGLNNAAIATRLSISAKTVDNHRTRLMAKLGVHSISELVAYALREGFLDDAVQM